MRVEHLMNILRLSALVLIGLSLFFLLGSAQAGDVASSEASGELGVGVGTQPAPSPTFAPTTETVSESLVGGTVFWVILGFGAAAMWGYALARYVQVINNNRYPRNVTHVKFRAKDIKKIRDNVADMMNRMQEYRGEFRVTPKEVEKDNWQQGLER